MKRFNLYIDCAYLEDIDALPARLREIATRVEDGEYISSYRTIFDEEGTDIGRFGLKDPRRDPGAGPKHE